MGNRFDRFFEKLEQTLTKGADTRTGVTPSVGSGDLSAVVKSLSDKMDVLLAALNPDPEHKGEVIKAIEQLRTDQDQTIEVIDKALDRVVKIEKGGVVSKQASGDDSSTAAGAGKTTVPVFKNDATESIEKTGGTAGMFDDMLRQMRSGRKISLV